MNIRIDIAYDGRDFKGFQYQKEFRTVQGEIEKILYILYNKKIRINPSGRTDTGVHALNQVISFKTSSIINIYSLKRALKQMLPRDIMLNKIQLVNDDFHSRYSAIAKTYIYKFTYRDILNQRFYKKYIDSSIDLKKIINIKDEFLGKHDFYSFSNRRKNEGSTIRNILDISLIERENGFNIEYTADGFLYRMVRIITEFLILVAKGKLDNTSIKDIIKRRDRYYTKSLAEPYALYLKNVYYSANEIEEYLKNKSN